MDEQVARITWGDLGFFDVSAAQIDAMRRSVGPAMFRQADLVIGPDTPNMFSLHVNRNGDVGDEVGVELTRLIDQLDSSETPADDDTSSG